MKQMRIVVTIKDKVDKISGFGALRIANTIECQRV